MHYYFAPMEGVTGAVYRRTHHEFFSGVDKYFMPFITPTTNEKLTPRQSAMSCRSTTRACLRFRSCSPSLPRTASGR
ncbi:MAG: hypothetical protein ACLRVN_00425 [Butyricicoccus sp.]